MPIINIWRVPAAAIAILSLCSITAAGQAKADDKNEQQAVLQAVTGFYDALAVIFEGDTGAMEKVWSHTGDVTYMGPDGGYLEGWEQVRKNWRKQAEVQMGSGGGKVTPERIRIVVGQDIAVVHNLEKGRADVKGKDAVVSLRATNLFRKENGTWKQIGHHADLLPPLAKAIGK